MTHAKGARAIAEKYLGLATLGDADAIAELYAENAELLPIPPNTAVVKGRDAIREYYQKHLSNLHPEYVSLDWTVDGRNCVVEIDSRVSGEAEHVYVVDIFTMTEDGKIARMAAYRRESR